MNLWAVVEDGKHIHPCDTRFSLAYWSWGSDEAVEEFCRRWRSESGNDHDPEYLVKRIDTKHSPESNEPHEEGRLAVLREAGWRCEDDTTCDNCGLATLDGEFPVCPECWMCTDCGCECEPPTHAVGFDPIAIGS